MHVSMFNQGLIKRVFGFFIVSFSLSLLNEWKITIIECQIDKPETSESLELDKLDKYLTLFVVFNVECWFNVELI